MPFAKRIVEPQLLCRYQIPNDEGLLFGDLVSISNVALSRTLRQLSDLARHACSVFQELESDLTSTGLRIRGLQGKVSRLEETCSELDPKQEAVPVSNLDVESKLTAHFQAPWHQQRNVFRPSTRPACIEDLHRQANVSLWSLHQDHQQRRSCNRQRRVTIAITTLPPMRMYPSPHTPRNRKKGTHLLTFETTRSSSPTECCHFSPWSRKASPSDPDTDGVALGHRSKFPIPNIPSTLDKQTNWSKALPLPTPEERMKSNSQVVTSCVIPINVTGVGFDRDASVRCSLVHSQSLLQRRRKLRRRRTVAGVPRQVQQDLDSDDSPSSRERTVIVHASLDITPSSEELTGHLNTRDSGCQTEDFLISGAPSRRRIRAQHSQGTPFCLSQSAGNISSLQDSSDAMFTASVARLRSRSLPRDGSVMEGHNHSDDEEDTEDFLPAPVELIMKDEEESADDQTMSGGQLGSLKYKQLAETPEHRWMQRTRSQLPRKADMGSCDMSSSSDTFSSPVHSVTAAGVLGSQMDHKEDHQSSSGNWSGSSSTCPSQTSETIPPAASPPLTGSSHCDSELSLNAATHPSDEPTGFMLDHYPGIRSQRTGSFSSTAMDILEEVGIGTPIEGEWSYPNSDTPRAQDFSPEPIREAESSLGCPSFTSMATCESSYSDKPISEKADTVSHYSVDTEGYYTSMHFDCGLKGSKSFTYNYTASGSDCGLLDSSHHMSLGRRCLSLRKPKAKPSPPKRSSSLRKICSEGNIPLKKEPKITCGQQLPLSSKERNLQLVLSGSPGHTENSSLDREPDRVWGVEGSVDLPDLGVFSSTDGHSFKDEGVVQSDYADLWLMNDLKSSDPYRSLSNSSTATGTTVIECIKSQESSESQTSQSGSRATTPSLPSVEGDFKLTSPEKLAGLASPSSGYSSQSETPTSSFPSAFFPGPLSPSGGKRKPKVPERKSSLSSVSCRDGATSKRDLELPIIPPSHLDLSSLNGVNNKASALRTSIQFLHHNNQGSPKPVTPSNSEGFNPPQMSITPTVLHAVQLRPIFKEHEGICDNETPSRLILDGPLSSSKPLELASPYLYNSPQNHTPPNESFEQLFTTHEELPHGDAQSQSEMWKSQIREAKALSENITVAKLECDIPSSTVTTEAHEAEEGIEPGQTPACTESESLQPCIEEIFPETTSLLTAEHSSAEKVNEDYRVTADSHFHILQESNEDTQEFVLSKSSVSAESAYQDGKKESKTDEILSKDSTPSENSSLPLSDEIKPDDDVFLSPTKTRTTEDLFAMIHRSKRKVLGRKDSTELALRNCLGASSVNTPPSSPASPNVSVVSAGTPPGLQKVPGPIYRNAKKSSTSNEEFKLLLLKKGSRSDSSYRMSAIEILKSPITPKSSGDSLSEPNQEELASPLQKQNQSGPDVTSSPYPKANVEGFSPKSFSSASSRQGRSRIPPPANSSRYGVRGRLYSAPMQAISEGETENSDGSPHDDRSSQGSE